MAFLSRISSPFQVTLLFALTTMLVACGGSYETEHIKDYRLAVVDGDDSDREELQQLITDFNDQAGMHVLTYVTSADDANSAVLFVNNLEAKTKATTGEARIGQAQWFMETASENPMSAMGRNPKRTVTYTMRIELDAQYMHERRGWNEDKKTYDKQKLFFHEVGHGLELDHNKNDKADLMYPSTDGDKDLGRFFRYVRSYMGDA